MTRFLTTLLVVATLALPATADATEHRLTASTRVVAGQLLVKPSSTPKDPAAWVKALGASMGATRVVTDRGWAPHARQIGTTGVVIDPDLYLAFGISGAVQHWVGMMDSRTIVAINSDKNAPLMKRAHYRIAGDLNAVIPKLIKLIQ